MVNQLAEFLKIGVVQVLDVPKISQDPAGGTAGGCARAIVGHPGTRQERT